MSTAVQKNRFFCVQTKAAFSDRMLLFIFRKERQIMLTEQRRRFAEEYLVDQNATQAAIRAGYSPRTAYSSGARLLRDVEVRELIQQGLLRARERAEWGLQDFVRELDEARQVAANEGQAAAMITASTTKAKALGVFVDKKQAEVSGGIEVLITRFGAEDEDTD